MKGTKGRVSFIFIVIAIGVIAFVIISWKHDPKSLKPVEYSKWIQNPENGLKVEKKMQGITFTIQYQPAEYIVANSIKDPYLKTSVLNVQIRKYSDLEYYSVRIENNKSSEDILMLNVSDKKDYYNREGYYSYDFADDIYMVRNNDTIPCAIFNYVPNYGVAPYVDFFIAFAKNENGNEKNPCDRQIVINDRVFDKGLIKFLVKKSDINNIPSIITY